MKILKDILIAVMICLIIFCFWLLSNIDYSILENKTLYKILKDQGAIIGALLAILGVAWMVKSQAEATNKSMLHSQEMLRKEILESKKQKNIDCFSRISCTIVKRFFSSSTENAQMIFNGKINVNHLREIAADMKYLDLHLIDSDGHKFLMVMQEYINSCLLYGTLEQSDFVYHIGKLNNMSWLAPEIWQEKICVSIQQDEDTGQFILNRDHVGLLEAYRLYIEGFILPSLESHIKGFN